MSEKPTLPNVISVGGKAPGTRRPARTKTPQGEEVRYVKRGEQWQRENPMCVAPGTRTRQRARNRAVAMLWHYLHSAGYAGRAGATREKTKAEIAGIIDDIIAAATPPRTRAKEQRT